MEMADDHFRSEQRQGPGVDHLEAGHGRDTGGLGQAFGRDADDLDLAHHTARSPGRSRARDKPAGPFRARVVAVENRVHGMLVRYSIAALRVAIGATFLGFGVLKFFPNVSPAMNLATMTTDRLTFGLIPGSVTIDLIATLESVIGICFLVNRWMRLAVSLLAVELIGILSPVVLLTGRLFSGPHGAPTLEGQYVLKDIILVAGGMVVAAATFRGGRLVRDEPPPTVAHRGAQSFDAEHKIEIVLSAAGGNRSVEEVCREHGISQGAYYQWRDILLDVAGKALDERSDGDGATGRQPSRPSHA